MQSAGQDLNYPILIRFAKTGLMRFIGHLDWQALQQAMFLRAGLRIAVGEGPTKRLRMKTSPPTPVAVASLTELTYLMLGEPLYPDEAQRRLSKQCPDGIEIVKVLDAGRLARKNPFAAIAAAGYSVDFGSGLSESKRDEIVSELKRIKGDEPPDGFDPDGIGKFWGRILEIETGNGETRLLVKQLEGETFHGAKCAEYLEAKLGLPHYPIFTKLDYYRLKPSKRRLFT